LRSAAIDIVSSFFLGCSARPWPGCRPAGSRMRAQAETFAAAQYSDICRPGQQKLGSGKWSLKAA
jgi:hypothetical protein